ncbi:MAG: hypothetical protein SFX73_10500 [Kofleriaceae bacterium]|nr:hypothetical protein [Kofleriaceae bacterium]
MDTRWLVALSLAVTIGFAFVLGRAPRPRAPQEPPLFVRAASVPPGPGPVPACELPPAVCKARCDELVPFAPASGPGYVDVPVKGEESAATSTSYVRRDLMMRVQYAAAKVACVAAGWQTGNGGPIALGDMSEVDGRPPGSRTGRPRHMTGSHTRGRDIDLAYFQRATGDNQIRPICDHTIDGVKQYRCLGEPTTLDSWRTALLIGALMEEPGIRVIGIDGKAAPAIEAALRQLCRDHWLPRSACERGRLQYELQDEGRGWYHAHHHHLHVSWDPTVTGTGTGVQ